MTQTINVFFHFVFGLLAHNSSRSQRQWNWNSLRFSEIRTQIRSVPKTKGQMLYMAIHNKHARTFLSNTRDKWFEQ